MNSIHTLAQENEYFSEIQTIVINRWISKLPSYAEPIDLIGTNDEELLKNASFVAQLCLNQLQNRLPHWTAFNSREYLEGRKGFSHEANSKAIHSLHLCEINWATSGPGFSWPENYYLHYLEGYEILILTISQDTPDAYGYVDLAVSAVSIPYLENISEAAKQLLSRWWAIHSNYIDEGWESLLQQGLISESEALSLRDDIWNVSN